MLCRSAVLVGAALAGVLGRSGDAMAQALKDVQTADTPLVLKAQGSFFVGGDKVEQTEVELGGLGPGGHITVNQMYVRYMLPRAMMCAWFQSLTLMIFSSSSLERSSAPTTFGPPPSGM